LQISLNQLQISAIQFSKRLKIKDIRKLIGDICNWFTDISN